MKRIISIFLLAIIPVLGFAAEEGMHYDAANNDLSNTASLQRGAKYFVNYCSGCHSLKYVRFNRVGEDLGLTKSELQLIMFTADKDTAMMTIPMAPSDANAWFGRTPPDLSLVARSRGADYLYTYLRTFYLDPSRDAGTNNLVLKNAAMPDPLWQLQGYQKAVFKMVKDADGNAHKEFEKFEQVEPGRLTPKQFDGVVRDIVNFLVYVGEPAQLKRRSLGIEVFLFLLVFFGFAYFLKKEFWRDVH